MLPPSPGEGKSKTILGFLSVPGWVYMGWVVFWEIIQILEHLFFIKDRFPGFAAWILSHAPQHVDVRAVVLSAIWIFAMIFVAPIWGERRAFAAVSLCVLAAAMVLGARDGYLQVQKENQDYRSRLAAQALNQ
jgi:hypothetical protein